MSTQKAKFELFNRLQSLGFTYEEAVQLRRIEMTLHRWAELECGDGNDFASWGIERDEKTDKPYMVTHPHNGPSRRRAIADKEKGALKRLDTIMTKHPSLIAYQQTDPRGCALYIVHKPGIVETKPGQTHAQALRAWVESNYTRGLAVCA